MQRLTIAALCRRLACRAFARHAPRTSCPRQQTAISPPRKADLARRLAIQPITGKAKNVIILFVGDGMSISTVTAARIYEGQKRGVDGESNNLAIDTFPYSALSKTYSHDGQVSDSAPTATAMVTGVKTNNGRDRRQPDA